MSNEAVTHVAPVIPVKPVANPAPLGLCAFALTTFVLSSANAGLFKGEAIVLGLAFFYGGLAQILAGMWEFKVGNTFGATAFTSYGAFWIAFAEAVKFEGASLTAQGVGFFLLAWTIFTLIMLIAALRINMALIALFTSLLITFALLTAAKFTGTAALGTYGGYFGLLTAFIAWYTAAAGLLVATNSSIKLPVGPRG